MQRKLLRTKLAIVSSIHWVLKLQEILKPEYNVLRYVFFLSHSFESTDQRGGTRVH